MSRRNDRLADVLLRELHPLVVELVREQVRLHLEERFPRWLTPAQAGERLGLGASGVRERIRRGTLPAHRLEGRLYIAAADIDGAIESAPSATVATYFDNKSPREAATSGGAATRKEP